MLKESKIKQLFSRRFTFMLVPNGPGKARQISIHFSVLLLLFVTWTGVTFWGSYLSAQHVDYWRTQASNQVLRLKLNYLMAQLDKSQNYLDQVKDIEANLRGILELNSRLTKNGAKPTGEDATGGPTVADQNELLAALNNVNSEVSWNRIVEKIQAVREEALLRKDGFDELSTHIEKQRRQFMATPMGWPCPGNRTSHFGKRFSPFSGIEEFHFGVDIAASHGTPIHATADGVVKVASWHMGYGNLVVLQHEFGYSTRYGHNSKLKVKAGDRVKRGQVIALMGNTGRSSGPHCHYEVWQYDRRQNPYAYMQGTPKNINPISKLPEEVLKPVLKNPS